MPTYEYECDSCGHRFDKFQNMTEPPLKRCPKCRHKVRRLFSSGGGLIFKGKGFYITDYRSESYKTSQKSEKGESVEKKTKEPGKTESKTEAKAESRKEAKKDGGSK